jgi:DNA-binding NarL/FixJ family response regulator
MVEIAIGDPELAEYVRDLLLGHGGFDVVTPEHGRTPDVLVTDSAEELVDDPADAMPVVVLGDASRAADMLRSGATAVLPPTVSSKTLRTAVRAAALGLTTLPAEFRHALVEGVGRLRSEGEDDAPAAGLTARELQVLQLLAEGASNKEVARRLNITPHTAKFHVAAIAGKLGASGRTDAVAKAMRLGLVMV